MEDAHTKSPADVLAGFGVSEATGLTPDQFKKQLEKHGYNGENPTEPNNTEQHRTTQSRTMQNRTEQHRKESNNAEQSSAAKHIEICHSTTQSSTGEHKG